MKKVNSNSLFEPQYAQNRHEHFVYIAEMKKTPEKYQFSALRKVERKEVYIYEQRIDQIIKRNRRNVR